MCVWVGGGGGGVMSACRENGIVLVFVVRVYACWCVIILCVCLCVRLGVSIHEFVKHKRTTGSQIHTLSQNQHKYHQNHQPGDQHNKQTGK